MAFQPIAKFVPGDPIGQANWALTHYLDHAEINGALADNSDTTISYPLQRMEEIERWLAAHQRLHQNIWTAIGGGTTVDLARVDWEKDDEVLDWLDLHAIVHAQIRESLSL